MLKLSHGAVAEWLRRGLQNLLHRFNSGRCLQNCLKKGNMEENKIQKVERVVEIRKGENNQTVVSSQPSIMQLQTRSKKKYSQTVQVVRSVCVWIVILMTALMAMVALIAMWANLDGEIVAKTFGTMFIVGFAAGVIMFVAPALDKTEQ